MHRVLFVLAAAGFLAGSLSWLAGARRAYRRAVAVEHRGLQAVQWRSLAAKDGLAGALRSKSERSAATRSGGAVTVRS
jgi:hypothetical protein